ncbi:MAG: OadG family protein [Treponema sp.]|jgi:oxaloacetate decarboxylase gamma subunit|nr:OadG family protein [Treponema sp.]
MTIAEMFGQSIIVTLLGMGVVFGFLVILIVSITLAGNIIHALGLDKDLQAPVKAKVPTPAPVSAAVSSVGTGNNAAVTAAIAAAVTEYRKTYS